MHGDAGGGERAKVGSESRSVREPPASSEDREPATTGGFEASTDVGSGPRPPRATAHRLKGGAFPGLVLILIVAAAARLVGIGR